MLRILFPLCAIVLSAYCQEGEDTRLDSLLHQISSEKAERTQYILEIGRLESPLVERALPFLMPLLDDVRTEAEVFSVLKLCLAVDSLPPGAAQKIEPLKQSKVDRIQAMAGMVLQKHSSAESVAPWLDGKSAQDNLRPK